MTVGVLLLAAGSSRRFGSDKRLATLANGKRLLDAAIENCLHSDIPLKICIGANDHDLHELLDQRGLDVVVCPHSQQGMGATLADAAECLAGWSAALVALGDMPMIRPATITAIAKQASPNGICVPYYRQQQGHPVAFGDDYFELLQQCEGDRGARWVIEKYPRAIRQVAVDDPGILRDVDTPKALREL